MELFTLSRLLEIAGKFDGYIFGSPVHFAAASGAITSFMIVHFMRVHVQVSSLFI
jgi:hypothetical protein